MLEIREKAYMKENILTRLTQFLFPNGVSVITVPFRLIYVFTVNLFRCGLFRIISFSPKNIEKQGRY